MIRKLLCSVFVMVVAVAFVAAEDFSGVITGVDGNKFKFQEMTKAAKGKKSEKVGDQKSLTATDKTEFFSKKVDKDTKKAVEEANKDGFKADAFAKADAEKGTNATISIEDGKVTKIVTGGGKKKPATE